MTLATLAMPEGLEALGELLDQVAERQRQDFGQLDSEAKADGSLITACDRWSDAVLVEGLRAEGVSVLLSEQNVHFSLRVADRAAELERSVASLKRQAAKAERFLAYRTELEDLQLFDASHRYLELVDQVGSGSLALNLAESDYTPILETIGRTIVSKKATFTLQREPRASTSTSHASRVPSVRTTSVTT